MFSNTLCKIYALAIFVHRYVIFIIENGKTLTKKQELILMML